MPSQTANLFLLADLVEVSRTSKLADLPLSRRGLIAKTLVVVAGSTLLATST